MDRQLKQAAFFVADTAREPHRHLPGRHYKAPGLNGANPAKPRVLGRPCPLKPCPPFGFVPSGLSDQRLVDGTSDSFRQGRRAVRALAIPLSPEGDSFSRSHL
jgi:hypothetical protein